MPREPYATVADALADRADDDGTALRFEGREWSWRQVVAEMGRRTELIRHWTSSLPGPPHVGVLLENVPEFLFQLGGAALAGTVLVGLNSTRRGEELARDIRHTDCAVVVTDGAHRPLLRGLDLGGARVVEVAGDGGDAGDLAHGERAWSGDAGECVDGERVDGQRVDGQRVDGQRASSGAAGGPVGGSAGTPGRPAPTDLLVLLFTSGSTGAPKAVRVTQGRLAGSTAGTGIRRDDVLYCAMPLFHGNALFSSVAPAIGAGATIVLRRRFSASAFAGDVAADGCTFAATVGRALAHVVSQPPSAAEAASRLRWVLAPESAPADVAAFQQRFGCPVITGYGSSENAVILVPAPGLPPDALGVPLPGLDVAVVDPETGAERPRARLDGDGRLTNPEEAVGEIVGRNALGRFEGYYANDEATTERTRGGWYWTGDLGYVDDQGVFYFAGRTADWLRVDSENFSAGPVERILARYPGVTGVAVFGVPDERTADDQVMAVLELPDAEGFDPGSFDRFLAEQPDLGTKWAPRYVRVMARLPVGATNKVDRVGLKRAGWREGPVWWRPDRRGPLRPMDGEDRAAVDGSLRANRRGP